MLAAIGRLADAQIDGNSMQNAGILLAGTMKNVAQQGRFFGAVIQLAGQSKNVSVLSDREFEAKVDQQVLVLGVVVRDLRQAWSVTAGPSRRSFGPARRSRVRETSAPPRRMEPGLPSRAVRRTIR